MKWRVRLICCGRDDGEYLAATWQEADGFREAYCSGTTHQRAGIVEALG